MIKSEMLQRISALTIELEPIETDIQAIELQLIEARASIKAGDSVSADWRIRARDALNHLRKQAKPIRAEIKRLNIERMAPNQDSAKRKVVKLERRFADVFTSVARETLPKETYNKIKRLTNQRLGQVDDVDLAE